MSNENNISEEERKRLERENHPNTIEYRKIQAEIAKLKSNIKEKLEKLPLTQEEKSEILEIIEYHSMLKEAAKIPLIKINENCILEEVEGKVKQNIKDISNNMVKVVNAKIKEMLDKKSNG